MAYDASNLSAMSYANGVTWWSYKVSDADDYLWLPGYFELGYFDEAANMLRPGDLVHVVQLWRDEMQDGTVADVDEGGLAIVRRIKPHVVLVRIGG